MNQQTKTGHGTRKHLQTLLQQHRGKLFIEVMNEAGIKPSDWLREQAYLFLEQHVSDVLYSEAKEKDEAEWQQAIQNRLEGRAISKILKTIRA